MRFETLAEWLSWQETLHPRTIELGLERVGRVFQKLHPEPPPCKVVTVAGTNGKGSTVALFEAIYASAGYRVGSYTSPHLFRYNERIRIAGSSVGDASLCEAFQRVDDARGEVSLTYFEFGTLAALDLFYRAGLDVMLLETGLGGRLDAVNIVDADLAVITAIGLDHTDWLGTDRESIAVEKAGIMRPGGMAVCSDTDMPMSLDREAERLGTNLYRLNHEFGYTLHQAHWDWHSVRPGNTPRNALPLPLLKGAHQLNNAAGVLMGLALLADALPVTQGEVRQGLQQTRLPGRFQVVPGEVTWICDVAHNPLSAQSLADILTSPRAREFNRGALHAVVAMNADKDIAGTLAPMLPLVRSWHLADLPAPRGATAAEIERYLLNSATTAPIHTYANVTQACAAARATSHAGDCVVVYGSFQTVAACPACQA